MELADSFKTANEYKMAADDYNSKIASVEEKTMIQLQKIYYHIESAARNGRYQVSVILKDEGQCKKEVHNKVVEILTAKGFKVKLEPTYMYDLINISWE